MNTKEKNMGFSLALDDFTFLCHKTIQILDALSGDIKFI